MVQKIYRCFDKLSSQQNYNQMETNKKDNRLEDDRDVFKASKKKLNELVIEAKRKILQKDTKEAYQMIFSVLSDDKEKLGGENSIFLLPGLLVIAQTHIVEDRPKKAEEYLTAAYWNFLKHNKPEDKNQKSKSIVDLTKQQFNLYKTSLHRTFSKLYILKKQYNQAISEIQNASYMDSSSYGPEHPRTTINYYLMGKIFQQTGREQLAQAFYGKVAQIWYKYLKNYLKLDPQEQEAYQTDSLLLQEAITFLKEIQKYFDKKYSGQNNRNLFLPIMRTEYSLGLLYKVFGQHQVCRQYLKEVYRRCQIFLPQDDRSIQEVKSDLKDLGPEYEDYQRFSKQPHDLEMSNNFLTPKQAESELDRQQESGINQQQLNQQQQDEQQLEQQQNQIDNQNQEENKQQLQ